VSRQVVVRSSGRCRARTFGMRAVLPTGSADGDIEGGKTRQIRSLGFRRRTFASLESPSRDPRHDAADHLSCYGFPEKTTRHRQVGRRGVVFEHAVTPIPAPCPPTPHDDGLYPYQHGVRYNGNYALADRFTTLAEI